MLSEPGPDLRLLLPVGEPVVALGDGCSPVTAALRRAGHPVDAVSGDWPTIQRPRRHHLVVIEAVGADPAPVVHCGVSHLTPGGHLVVVSGDDQTAAHIGPRFDLETVAEISVGGADAVVFRRTARRTIHDVVFEARARIARTTADELAERLGDTRRSPTLVDTRTPTDRARFGVIAGSLHMPRTVVEFHLDPANGYRHAAAVSFEQPIVVVCNGGYSSSLAAAGLLDIGFTDVGDLVGGVRAWVGAGYPVVEPDHSHLDL